MYLYVSFNLSNYFNYILTDFSYELKILDLKCEHCQTGYYLNANGICQKLIIIFAQLIQH